MGTVRVGVIGCGYWGPNLIRNFADLPGAELVAVADRDEGRRARIKGSYPWVHSVANHDELFALGLDAVAIATPPATHYAIAKDCLEHDLNVLVEKPLTLKSVDAEELIELADRRGKKLMVGHTFEYNPAVRALKRSSIAASSARSTTSTPCA